MVSVCRPYGGITINTEVEYLLDDNLDVMEFPDVDTAKEWILHHGFDEEDIEYLMFVNDKGEILDDKGEIDDED